MIGTGRRSARLQALKNELGADCHPLAFDVGHRPEAEAAISTLPDEFKNVDILVNNAAEPWVWTRRRAPASMTGTK